MRTTKGALAPRAGYDLVAPWYQLWDWHTFWRANERPTVEELLRRYPRNARALDIGCGIGEYVQLISDLHLSAVGLDLSGGMLRRARELLQTRALFVQADATAVPLRSNSFDVVLCCRVLSHVSDLRCALGELARVLKPGGRALVSDIAQEHSYEATRAPARGRLVTIRTYKRPLGSLVMAARATRVLHLVKTKRLDATNLEWRPETGYRSIDKSGRKAIANILVFEKDTIPDDRVSRAR